MGEMLGEKKIKKLPSGEFTVPYKVHDKFCSKLNIMLAPHLIMYWLFYNYYLVYCKIIMVFQPTTNKKKIVTNIGKFNVI